MMKQCFKRMLALVLSLVLLVSVLPALTYEVEAAAYTGIMRQTESQWLNYSFNGGTLYATACGVFSLANAVGYLTGEKLDVVEIATWAHNNGMYNVTGADGIYRTSFYQRASARYGPTYGFAIDCSSDGGGYWSGASNAKLKNHLENGGTAVIHVYNHFMCLVGYDRSSNKFHLYDCAPRDRRGTLANGGDLWFTEAQLSSGYTDIDWFCLVSATKSDRLEGNQPLNMGKDFVAYIRHTATGQYVTDVNNNLEIAPGKFGSSRNSYFSAATQMFHFIYNANDGTYSIRNDAKNKWFDVSGGVYNDGTNMQLWDGNGYDTQRFYIYFTRGNFYFRCKASKKVFDVAAETGNLALWGENTGTNEVSSAARGFEILKLNMDYGDWYLNLGTDEVVYVRNVTSGKLMTASGTDVTFTAADYEKDQQWKMLRRANGSYEFVNVATGKYLDVAGGGIASGTAVDSWDCNGHRAQGFYVLPSDTEGYYVIKPCYSDNVLDMASDTGNLAIYPPHLDWEVPRAAQLFEIVFEGAQENTLEPAYLGEEFEAVISSKKNALSFTDLGNGTLQAQEKTGGSNQVFQFFYDKATQSYEILGSSGQALDVASGGYQNESLIRMYRRNNTPAQRYRLYEVEGGYALSPVHTNRLVEENHTTIRLFGTKVIDSRIFILDIQKQEPDQILLNDASAYRRQNRLVKNVDAETTVRSLLNQFVNGDLVVKNFEGQQITDLDVVGTGSTINLYEGTELVDTVAVVVRGDLDGNGVVDNTDYMRIKAALLGGFQLNEAESCAADVDDNGDIDNTDYMRIKSHFLDVFDLYQ